MTHHSKSVRVTINWDLAVQLLVVMDVAAPHLSGQMKRNTQPFYQKLEGVLLAKSDSIQEALK